MVFGRQPSLRTNGAGCTNPKGGVPLLHASKLAPADATHPLQYLLNIAERLEAGCPIERPSPSHENAQEIGVYTSNSGRVPRPGELNSSWVPKAIGYSRDSPVIVEFFLQRLRSSPRGIPQAGGARETLGGDRNHASAAWANSLPPGKGKTSEHVRLDARHPV